MLVTIKGIETLHKRKELINELINWNQFTKVFSVLEVLPSDNLEEVNTNLDNIDFLKLDYSKYKESTELLGGIIDVDVMLRETPLPPLYITGLRDNEDYQKLNSILEHVDNDNVFTPADFTDKPLEPNKCEEELFEVIDELFRNQVSGYMMADFLLNVNVHPSYITVDRVFKDIPDCNKDRQLKGLLNVEIDQRKALMDYASKHQSPIKLTTTHPILDVATVSIDSILNRKGSVLMKLQELKIEDILAIDPYLYDLWAETQLSVMMEDIKGKRAVNRFTIPFTEYVE